jgi:hypothetical protein
MLETVNWVSESPEEVPLSQWMQMTSMGEWQRWQGAVAAAT